MGKYLPSKKFLLIFLSIILALGIIYIFSFLNKPKASDLNLANIETQTRVQKFMAVDSDNDGLKDWEEALWKTDPQKPDTDNDGTNDNDEIILNKDPLKKNINPEGQEPSDKIDPEILANEKKIQDDFNKLTVTEKMGRELFSQYIATRKINSPLSETEKFMIVENTLSYLPTLTFKIYTEKEIGTINLSDNETLRNYSNAVAEIILINLKTPTEDVQSIITDFSNINDDKKLAQLTKQTFQRFSPLILKNQKTVLALLKVPVPQILIKEHLSLLNSFEEIYEGLDLIQKSAEDIITLIPLINNYNSSVNILADSLIKMTSKFVSLKITYLSKADYGNEFFNVIMFKK